MDGRMPQGQVDESGSGRAMMDALPLPPLPDPVIPHAVHGQPLAGVYDVIRALRREMDDPTSHQTILEMLEGDPNTTKAVATVLHQCGMLMREVVTSDGDMVCEPMPLPPTDPPSLPPGVTSWIASEGSNNNASSVSGYVPAYVNVGGRW